MTEPNDHPMDTFLGADLGWDEFTPDEQELIGFTIHEVAKLRPGWLTPEEGHRSIRQVRPASQRGQGSRCSKGDTWLTLLYQTKRSLAFWFGQLRN